MIKWSSVELVWAITSTVMHSFQNNLAQLIIGNPLRNKGWMDDLRFCVLFNSVSVIPGRREVDNDRLYAVELRLRLGRFRFERGSNSVR